MFSKLKRWISRYSSIHVRKRSVHSIGDLLDLLDRFLDSKIEDGIEWDDFISWKHENDFIEQIRDRIAGLEPLFFSEQIADLDKAVMLVTEERNRLAAILGQNSRPVPIDSKSN